MALDSESMPMIERSAASLSRRNLPFLKDLVNNMINESHDRAIKDFCNPVNHSDQSNPLVKVSA